MTLAGVALVGCNPPTPAPPPPIPPEPEPVATVIKRVNRNADRMPAGVLLTSPVRVEAGLIDKDGKEHHIDGDGWLRFAKPNKLHVEIKHGLGYKLFEIGSDGQRYWVWDKEGKTVWWGKYAHLHEPGVRDMPVRPDQVIAALGLTRLPALSSPLLGPWYQVTDRPLPYTLHPQCKLGYFMMLEDGRLSLDREYGISRVSPFLVERIEFRDKYGQVSCVATLARLGEVGVKKDAVEGPGPLMPQRVYLRLAKKSNFLILDVKRPSLKPMTRRLRDGWYPFEPEAGWDVIQIDRSRDEPPASAPTSRASTGPVAARFR